MTGIQRGLGNQLFQYAIGRRLAVAAGGQLFLMLLADNFAERYERGFGLQNFNIAGHVILQSNAAAALQELLPGCQIPTHVAQEKFIFDCAGQQTRDLLFVKDILSWRGGLQLYGFWQDERYFADIADIIRQDFTLKIDAGERNRILRRRILSAPSAFIHIRRGDYLIPPNDELFGACDADYYHQAEKLLRARHGAHLRIYVFSDDPGWARANEIGGPDAEFVDWNADAPWCDIDLMRNCQHAVISNSSFGWWGAWLGEWPGRSVIAPKIWFKAVPQFNEPVPDRWLRL